VAVQTFDEKENAVDIVTQTDEGRHSKGPGSSDNNFDSCRRGSIYSQCHSAQIPFPPVCYLIQD
jgi:hypothetical protein